MNKVHRTKSKRGRRRTAAVVGLALLIPVSGGIMFAATSDDPEPAAPPVAEEIRTLVVDTTEAHLQDTYQVKERFVGRAEAARTSDLGFELAGTIVSIGADEGQRVEKGQELATLDTSRLAARREELVATLTQATATLTLAESTLERMSKAVKSSAVSRQQHDEAMETRLKAEAAVNRVRSLIKAVDVDLEKSVLQAPFAGVISLRAVDEGTIVSPGHAVLRLVEVDKMEVRVGFSLRAASGLQIGDMLGIETESGKYPPQEGLDGGIEATVARILPERGQNTRTVDVILSVDNRLASLRPGDLVRVPRERTINERGFWLPRTALTESARGLWAGYVLTETDGRGADGGEIFQIERRQLEVIDESGEKVFVRGALGDGELVVSSGLQRLSPGQRVRTGPDPGAPSPAPATILGAVRSPHSS